MRDPVKSLCLEASLLQLAYEPVKLLLHLVLAAVCLAGKRVQEAHILLGNPAEHPVYLGGSHHKGGLELLEVVQRLIRLRLQTLVYVHHAYRPIGYRASPPPAGGAGLMPRAVSAGDP